LVELEYLESLESEELGLILEKVRDSEPLEAISILNLIAERAFGEDDFKSAIKWYSQIIEISRLIKNTEKEAEFFYKSGYAYYLLDDNLIAVECLKSAQVIYQNSGKDKDVLECLVRQADCFDDIEDYASLIEVSEQALNLARILEDYEQSAEMAIYLADAYYRLETTTTLDVLEENHIIGLEYAEEAVLFYEITGDQPGLVRAICEVCEALLFLDRSPEVMNRIRDAIEIIRNQDLQQSGNRQILAKALRIKASAHRKLTEFDQALSCLQEAEETAKSPDIKHSERLLAFIHLSKSYCKENLLDSEGAIDEIQRALRYADGLRNNGLYYSCLQQYIELLYWEDRYLEALFICRGAIGEFEVNQDAKIKSDFYFFFIQEAATCLHALSRWPELLEILEKILLIQDYLPSAGRASRIDSLKAEALFELERAEESLEILDALLNFGNLDENDQDIGDAYLIRAAILKQKSFDTALEDFRKGAKILKSQNLLRRVNRFVKDNPEFDEEPS
jgi:tetratricopeptide (TPR) repeat protein